MPDAEILDIDASYVTDTKITKIEYHSYIPYTNSFRNNDEIRILVQQSDTYPYLHDSCLYIEGKIAEPDKVSLYNNGVSQLFEQVRLEINGVEVDRTRALGVTSSIKNYLSCTPDEYYCYENAGWTFRDDTSIHDSTTGKFSVCIPLKYWMGFFEDFKKILVNSRLELILTRKNVDPFNIALVSSVGTVTTSKVPATLGTGIVPIEIKKIVWKIPHVSVDDRERLKLMKNIEKEKSLFIPFRSYETYEYPELGDSKKVVWNLKTASKLEKPRYVILALRKNNGDGSKFQHCELTNVKVYLNSVMYPYNDLNIDFNTKNYSTLYDMYTSFQESYYGKETRSPILSLKQFMERGPIVVIDTSKQNDSATVSSVDVSLEIEASKNLKEVSAYCVLIHDRIVEYIPLTREVRKLV